MILGEEPITLRRPGATTWTAGRPVIGASTDIPIQAGVQPATGADRQVLEEGLRSRKTKRVYTATELFGVDDRDANTADRLLIGGETYVVQNVVQLRKLIPHYKAIAVRLTEDP